MQTGFQNITELAFQTIFKSGIMIHPSRSGNSLDSLMLILIIMKGLFSQRPKALKVYQS